MRGGGTMADAIQSVSKSQMQSHGGCPGGDPQPTSIAMRMKKNREQVVSASQVVGRPGGVEHPPTS
jgi:hypothetical protein